MVQIKSETVYKNGSPQLKISIITVWGKHLEFMQNGNIKKIEWDQDLSGTYEDRAERHKQFAIEQEGKGYGEETTQGVGVR